MIMTSVALHGIYATHQNKLLNIYPSLVKLNVNTQSLPSSINIYIDPRGEPYSVAPRFVFCCLLSLVKSDIDHYYFDLSLGVSREFTIK